MLKFVEGRFFVIGGKQVFLFLNIKLFFLFFSCVVTHILAMALSLHSAYLYMIINRKVEKSRTANLNLIV